MTHPAAAEAKCDVVALDMVLLSSALPTPLHLHFLASCHWHAATANEPVTLLAEDSWIRLVSLSADIFPFRTVIQTHPVRTHFVHMCPRLCQFVIVMVHNNPPFWPPVFLGADCIIHKLNKTSSPHHLDIGCPSAKLYACQKSVSQITNITISSTEEWTKEKYF